MNEFERLYYEDDAFWSGSALQDDANAARIKYTANLVPDDVQSLVDLGCGNGIFLQHLATVRSSVDLLGVDRSERALSYVSGKKLRADIHETRISDSSYDCVTCLEVIEHLPVAVYQATINELARISRKYVIVSVPFEEDLEESSNQCPCCKTIFNRELHLRSFNDIQMRTLFKEAGFVCKVIDHLGGRQKLKFHHQYRKLFYPEQFRKFESPICPVCGYTERKRHASKAANTKAGMVKKWSPKKGLLSTISAIPKTIWPKEMKYYWVIALYEKV